MGYIIGDSAYPPTSYPTVFQGQPIVGWCVYIGGNTPHPWTAAEIARLKAQPWCRYIVPIFTRSNPQNASAAQDVAIAVWWAKTYGQPSGTLTMWDAETAVAPAYYSSVDKLLRLGDGDLEILYGSKATVTQNPRPSGGYDEASWTGQDYAPADTADQFGSWDAYDLNDFKSTAPLWDLRSVPVPTSLPSTTISLEEDTMQQIESLSAHPGVYNFPTVSKSHFRLTVGDGGTAEVRVVAWDAVGNDLVLCGDQHDGTVRRGARDFAIDAAHVSHVTVERKDTGSFPIGVIAF